MPISDSIEAPDCAELQTAAICSGGALVMHWHTQYTLRGWQPTSMWFRFMKWGSGGGGATLGGHVADVQSAVLLPGVIVCVCACMHALILASHNRVQIVFFLRVADCVFSLANHTVGCGILLLPDYIVVDFCLSLKQTYSPWCSVPARQHSILPFVEFVLFLILVLNSALLLKNNYYKI